MTELHQRCLTAAAIVTIGVTGTACEQEQSAPPAALIVDELRRSRLAAVVEPDGPLIQFPIAVTQWRDSIVIADGQGARIIVLPRTLEGGREFGRRGEGPGELESPQALASSGDELVVNDRGNLRATWFDPSGTQLRSRQLRVPSTTRAHFGILADGRLVVPAASPEHYVEVISADGGLTPALPRPAGAMPCLERPITANMVVNSAEGVFLVDTENGLTVRWSGDSAPVMDSIPPRLLAAGQSVIDSTSEASGEDYVCLMPIQAANASEDGLLVWVAGLTSPAGAVLRPSGEWALIDIANDVRADFPAHPWDVLLLNDELFVLAPDGIRVFGLSHAQ